MTLSIWISLRIHRNNCRCRFREAACRNWQMPSEIGLNALQLFRWIRRDIQIDSVIVQPIAVRAIGQLVWWSGRGWSKRGTTSTGSTHGIAARSGTTHAKPWPLALQYIIVGTIRYRVRWLRGIVDVRS